MKNNVVYGGKTSSGRAAPDGSYVCQLNMSAVVNKLGKQCTKPDTIDQIQ